MVKNLIKRSVPFFVAALIFVSSVFFFAPSVSALDSGDLYDYLICDWNFDTFAFSFDNYLYRQFGNVFSTVDLGSVGSSSYVLQAEADKLFITSDISVDPLNRTGVGQYYIDYDSSEEIAEMSFAFLGSGLVVPVNYRSPEIITEFNSPISRSTYVYGYLNYLLPVDSGNGLISYSTHYVEWSKFSNAENQLIPSIDNLGLPSDHLALIRELGCFIVSNVVCVVQLVGVPIGASSDTDPIWFEFYYGSNSGSNTLLRDFASWYNDNAANEGNVVVTDFPSDWSAWIFNSISGFFDAELAPGLSLGGVFAAIFGVVLTWFILHLFM